MLDLPPNLLPAIAIITVFNAAPGLLTLCSSLLCQVEQVIIVDDASEFNQDDVLDHCERLGCTVVRQPHNLGVAAALNAGIALAIRREPTPLYVLTFDHDSSVPRSYVKDLADAALLAVHAGIRVGMVAPEKIEGLPTKVKSSVGTILFGDEPIQSGLLIPVPVIQDIGIFLESLFIDAIDTEYFLRARKAGYEVILARDVELGHSLGTRFYPRVFGHQLTISGNPVGLVRSAPFRYYYIARNHITVLRLYSRAFPWWGVRETILDLRHFFILLLLAPGRLELVRMLAAGWRDGMAGVGGRIPPGLLRINRR